MTAARLILTTLIIFQSAMRTGDSSDTALQDPMQKYREQLSTEMKWLVDQVEQGSQEMHRHAQEYMLLNACQNWFFWAAAEILLMLFGLYWLPRKERADSGSGNQQGSSSSAAEEETQGEEDE